jgi:hypothetical protein
MFRYLNVRTCHEFYSEHHKSSRASVEGNWTTDLDSPPNNPDGFFLRDGEDQRTIVCVHGVDWDHDETPAGHAEIFKRLFQSGSNARYVGVSWASDMSRRIDQPLAYGSDVIGAFLAAPYVTTQLESAGLTGADTTDLAHSLGNVLVSSAIADHDLDIGNYIMLNPAVPVESYDGRQAGSDRDNMVHPDWRASTNIYAERLMCAAWGGLFSTNDPRSRITWNNRFASVPSRTTVSQFYSTGEEILRQSDGVVPSVGALRGLLAVSLNWLPLVDISVDGTLVTGERVWVYNEMTKGQPGFVDQLFVGNHNLAGWRFNTDYDVQKTYYDDYGIPYYVSERMPSAQANGLATTNLIANPFFDPFQDDDDDDIPDWPAAVATLYTNDGANATFPLTPLSTATTNQILWHAKLLAEAVPPLSGPAGSIPVTEVAGARRFNMMDPPFRDTALWPATRPRKSHEQQSQRRWLHGDYKDAPYLLTHGLYRKIAEIERR